MDDADLYKGVVSPEKQAEHEGWLEARYGQGIREHIEHGRQVWSKMGPDEVKALMAELKAVEEGLADALRLGVPSDSTELDPLLQRHQKWVGLSWSRMPTAAAYAGLADLYTSHPDFVARYEAIAPGFAQYLGEAMKAWSARQPEM